MGEASNTDAVTDFHLFHRPLTRKISSRQLKIIPMMDGGDDVGMVLSPQCFHNLNAEADIFNHSNIPDFEYDRSIIQAGVGLHF